VCQVWRFYFQLEAYSAPANILTGFKGINRDDGRGGEGKRMVMDTGGQVTRAGQTEVSQRQLTCISLHFDVEGTFKYTFI